LSKFPELLASVDVRAALGTAGKPLSKASLERRLALEPDFPKPFLVGRDRRWFADEVREWILSRTRRQYYGAAE
jgi:hypothetical protein